MKILHLLRHNVNLHCIGIASQSSTGWGGIASRAIDGKHYISFNLFQNPLSVRFTCMNYKREAEKL